MSENIFISYRREDSQGFARAIYTSISNKIDRRNIFMDVDTIEPGLDFVDAIEKAIGQCSVLIAIIGPKWLGKTGEGKARIDDPDDYIRVEIASALKRGILVIPVLVEEAKMPSSEVLPDDLKPLVRRNALPLSHQRFNADMDKLEEMLWKFVPSEEEKDLPPKDQADEETRRKLEEERKNENKSKKYFSLIGGIGFIVVGISVYLSIWFPNESFELKDDPFLIYYLIGVPLVVVSCWVTLSLSSDKMKLDTTKYIYFITGFLFTIAVLFRGMDLYAYVHNPEINKIPTNLYVRADYVPYLILLGGGVLILYYFITVFTRTETNVDNKKILFKHCTIFLMYIAICRLTWEIIDWIARIQIPNP